MAPISNVVQVFIPDEAAVLATAGFPQYVCTPGPTFGLSGLSYDGAGSLPQEAA